MDFVRFAPNGHTLASTSWNSVILWDVRDPARPHRLGDPLRGHDDATPDPVFAPDGRMLATANADSVTLWDITEPGRVRRLTELQTVPTTASGATAVAFAPRCQRRRRCAAPTARRTTGSARCRGCGRPRRRAPTVAAPWLVGALLAHPVLQVPRGLSAEGVEPPRTDPHAVPAAPAGGPALLDHDLQAAIAHALTEGVSPSTV